MRLGQQLGTEAVNELSKHQERAHRILFKQRHKAREAELNRKRSRGEIIRYHEEQ